MAQIKIRIICGATEEKIVWKHDTESMLLSVLHNSVDGIANKFIAEYLSAVLDLPKGKINIIKGLDKANKTIEIDSSVSFIKEKITLFNAN